jgi:hypothetical protein
MVLFNASKIRENTFLLTYRVTYHTVLAHMWHVMYTVD